MRIEKVNYDKQYPYCLKDSWGGVVCLTEEDLKKLPKEIEKILDKSKRV